MKASFLSTAVLSLLSVSTSVLARSSVYMVSETAKMTAQCHHSEVSFNSFSLVMSHLMNTLDTHPIMQLQDSYKQQALDGAQAVWNGHQQWFSNEENDLFKPKLQGNLFITVAGVQNAEVLLPDYNPAFYVTDNTAEDYAALAEDIALNTQERSGHGFVMHAYTLPKTIEEASEIVSSFKQNYPGVDASVFDMTLEADNAFITEMEQSRDAMKIFTTAKEGSEQRGTDFVSIKMTGLQTLLHAYGANSDKYIQGQHAVRLLLEENLIPTFQKAYLNNKEGVLATVVLSPAIANRFNKRDLPDTDATCYTTLSDCEEGTGDCSGHGLCGIVSDSCYACQCKASFLGESCEFVDSTSDFQLLFWTGVSLIILTSGVLVFIYNSGNIDNGGILMGTQSLPKQD
ncbi:hypothetical protein PHYBLDRAFT_157785 [Phycomyces blakesleeanus NRRL 1555(-)]|uniref:EGF-like domain-containing protein n=1 Tax=Phycomyces blakesleeanus (strain ATCC 8743b / DSM 1359 / FGSC 10004 / NBRC 33097 / NRRL 1555) TaxID=763407 RepID=A0A167PA72_PHYB8|nr:hypothetical protein PHYBLDRAFT_157785 [Phycomyces blakesleeanus NRRL 1555(-)]OAD77554.1 hypothetical protein PHYBLDRAFT_157785 [Phycomyces blakesleeanus NRRL 1555(-)]|eukprot:XP_018295594.1 hypothetical protein PHYBLDRAFT_157785 [Phycomyces blakesleeanus NRRL 1555(-)]